MKSKYIILFIAALIFVAAGILFLSDDIISPYVDFSQAKKMDGKYVQIIGTLDTSQPIIYTEDRFTFLLKDSKNETLKVDHKGIKPLNFEHADQVVALGKYLSSLSIFQADKLLVKCPSKYTKEKKNESN